MGQQERRENRDSNHHDPNSGKAAPVRKGILIATGSTSRRWRAEADSTTTDSVKTQAPRT
jgi:hypothetical protein